MSSAATQAKAQTGTGGEGHAEVASRLGNDAAGQFGTASEQVGGKLQGNASDAATELESHTQHASAAVGAHADTLQGQVDQTVEGAAGELAEGAHRSVASLQKSGEEAGSELHTAEAKIVDTIQSRSAEQRDRIYSAGAEAATGVRQQAQNTVEAAERQIAQHAEKLAAANVDEKTAREIASQVHSQVLDAYSTAAKDARQTESKIAGHLTQAGHDVTASLSRAVPATAAKVGAVTQSLAADAARRHGSRQRNDPQCVRSEGRSGPRGCQTSGTWIRRSGGPGRIQRGRSSRRARGSGCRRSQAPQRRYNERSRGRISDGQQRVDSYVSQKGATMQRSILGSIRNWFVEQFKGSVGHAEQSRLLEWAWLSPSCSCRSGPFAFVVGGPPGLSRVQRTSRGKSWYDWHNILTAPR
jgi:hypothetical protein